MSYELEKMHWTEADFPQMGWHDCHIYTIQFQEELAFDIDYICQWNQSDVVGLPYTFWVAPATLVFRRPIHLSFELSNVFNAGLEIESIEREQRHQQTYWTILTQQGNVEFISEGYDQFIRQPPTYQFGQTLSYQERYGFSLEKTTHQANPNRLRSDFIEQRQKDFEHYENVKQRQLKRLEKEQLAQLRETNQIELKDFLIQKKLINDRIEFYDYWLKGTLFENW